MQYGLGKVMEFRIFVPLDGKEAQAAKKAANEDLAPPKSGDCRIETRLLERQWVTPHTSFA
jgi:hypothetical protein